MSTIATEPEAAGEPRVHHVVLPDVTLTGAQLLSDLRLTILDAGRGLCIKLEPASARSLATELVRLADAKEPEA